MFSTSPYGYGVALFWFTLVTFILVWCALLLRLWVRIGMIKQFGWDDALIILAVACCTWLDVGIFLLVRDGLGRHEDTIPVPILVHLFKTYLIAEIGYVAGVGFFRLSVCAFFLRITPIRWHIWTIGFIMALTIVISVMYDLVVLFQCLPVSFFWTRITGGTHGTCLNPNTIVGFGYAHNSVSIATDWALAALPILLLYHSNMETRTKLTVLPVLSLGIVTSVAAVVRFTALTGLKAVGDFTHNSASIAFWSGAELSIGILAACAATYFPLFKSCSFSSSGRSVTKNLGATAQRASRFGPRTDRTRHHPEYLITGDTASKDYSATAYRASRLGFLTNRSMMSSDYILSGEGYDLAILGEGSQQEGSRPDNAASAAAVNVERYSVPRNGHEAGIVKEVDYGFVTSRY